VTPTLILVSGLSCTGKSTLAQKISDQFHLPYFSKDMLKELLFDELGYSDRSWSQKLGRASYSILYLLVQKLLSVGQSLILESNFKPQYDRPRLQKIQNTCPFRIIEVLCFADGQVLFERFQKRATTPGARHPGHVDHLCLDEQQKILSIGKAEPLNLGPVIEIDTTDFSKIDYSEILKKISM